MSREYTLIATRSNINWLLPRLEELGWKITAIEARQGEDIEPWDAILLKPGTTVSYKGSNVINKLISVMQVNREKEGNKNPLHRSSIGRSVARDML